MNYIEKDDCDCGCIDNSSSSSSSVYTESQENYERWKWLISGWSSMTFKEKMKLFFPYLHYVNPRNNYKIEFDDAFTNEIIETAYKTCRTLNKVKFDPDGRGVPNLIMIFNPIDPKFIPDATVKAEVISWGQQYGFYSSCCCNE